MLSSPRSRRKDLLEQITGCSVKEGLLKSQKRPRRVNNPRDRGVQLPQSRSIVREPEDPEHPPIAHMTHEVSGLRGVVHLLQKRLQRVSAVRAAAQAAFTASAGLHAIGAAAGCAPEYLADAIIVEDDESDASDLED